MRSKVFSVLGQRESRHFPSCEQPKDLSPTDCLSYLFYITDMSQIETSQVIQILVRDKGKLLQQINPNYIKRI